MKNEFLKLAETAIKMCIPNFYANERYYIFKDEHQGKPCYVLYGKKKGNRFNIFGTYWAYFHDAITGEFFDSFNRDVTVPDSKEQLLKADLIQMQAAFIAKHKNAVA